MCIAFLVHFVALGQSDFFSWIESGNQYLKITTAQTGIHYISNDKLAAAGVPLNNPDAIKLYHRGVEQAIDVTSEGLYFYGKENDGTLDAHLYVNNAQPHPWYNLFSDSTAYFLTWSSASGKRMETIEAVSSESPDTYHMQELIKVYTDNYSEGMVYNTYNTLSEFDLGEGWTGPIVSRAANAATVTHTVELETQNLYAQGKDAKVEVVLAGRNRLPHDVTVLVGNPNAPATSSSVSSFTSYRTRKVLLQVPMSAFSADGKLSLSIRLNSGSAADAVSISAIRLLYPQSFNMGGTLAQHFRLSENASGNSNLELPGAPANAVVYDITDENNIFKIASQVENNTLRAAVPNTTASRKILVNSNENLITVDQLKAVEMHTYRNADAHNANFILLSHPTLWSAASEYASYRRSGTGGGHKVLLADVEKIYDQFSYGEKTPLAIHNFCKYLVENGNPEYLFIFGKGLTVNFHGNTAQGNRFYRHDPHAFINNSHADFRLQDFIPPAGVPGTDNLYVMGLIDSLPSHNLAVPVGRAPVRNLAEARAYLQKVKDHESLDSRQLWRKHLVHISGGTSEYQQNSFRNNVNNLRAIVEDTVFGGNVVATYSKQNTNTVDDAFRESFSSIVNEGISYMTFFGHSAPALTEVDIGYVSNPLHGYNNYKKYPMILMNGCNSGNPYVKTSITEDWIITQNKGAILVLGHTDYGLTDQLYYFSRSFYQTAFRSRVFSGRSVGKIHQRVVRNFMYNNASNRTQVQQMMLQGDPSVKVYAPTLPDYHITGDNIFLESFDDNPVTAVSDSFQVGIVITNFGHFYRDDSVTVALSRTINGLTSQLGQIRVPGIAYKDTLYHTVHSRDANTFGMNVFDVVIDPEGEIEESDRTNNAASLSYFMPLTGVSPVFPKEYGIVSELPVTLIAQSTDLLIGEKDYYIELDTSHTFNSPFRKSSIINSGSLLKWDVPSLLPETPANDSTVYYWRARFNEIPTGQDTLWANSSFIYIKDSPNGWSQSAFPQFYRASLDDVVRDKDTRRWDFEPVQTRIVAASAGAEYEDHYNGSIPNTELAINDRALVFYRNEIPRGSCTANSILAVGFNRSTSRPYALTGNPCGHNQYADQTRVINAITAPSVLENVLNELPDNDHILLMSYGNVNLSAWGLKEILEERFGFENIDSLSAGKPFVLIGKKHPENTPVAERQPLLNLYGDADDIVHADISINGKRDRGRIASTVIGPSSGWGKLYRDIKVKGEHKEWKMTIKGYDLEQKNPVELYRGMPDDSLDLGFINHEQYPFIRLVAYISDTVNLQAPQLKRWQVIYNGVPEGTLNTTLAGVEQYKVEDRVEGDSVRLNFIFENISDLDFKDTVKVQYTLRANNEVKIEEVVPIGKLKAWEKLKFEYAVPTRNAAGKNDFQVYVNPKLQPEVYYHNNLLNLNYTVEKDMTSPVLDVAFDGIHIMDGDIVSPSPMINISINDENKYLLKKDTAEMRIFLKAPCENCDFKQVFFTDPEIVNYGQSADKKNSFKVDYNPKNLADGIYTLRIQGATDESGNSSGGPFEIKFEVVNEASITNIYPYPNPFSSSTRFVFTLTGSEIPRDMKIQIMTVTGKVVREIMMEELGPLRIGNNITEYAWDGTDEFGDRLANGVYLYRVVIRDGDDLNHRQTAGDKGFKKGYGKMYILR
ncbi:C25 family cysteine peptidase [Cytophagaceae bacterium ABcell3]|nr:C25 family cysteine peptidase [Cytophagaceae bacterium ABcell3]